MQNLQKRLNWDKIFQKHVAKLNKQKPVILCGDLNVFYLNIDVNNYISHKGEAGFTDEERKNMKKLLNIGFIDAFRLYPTKTEAFTFYRLNDKYKKDKDGWRLDYFLISKSLANKVRDVVHVTENAASDHFAIVLIIELI